MSISRKPTLQDKIDDIKANEILHLIPGEYAGPIVIDKPITLVGKNVTIWALEGPVLTINADASFINIGVEVTGESDSELTPLKETAILLNNSNNVNFDDVAVRGNVIGVLAETGIWRYPRKINLGQVKSRYQHSFIMKIVVPLTSTLVCSGISGLHVECEELKEGINEVTFILDEGFPNTFIYGNIYIKTILFKRYITICATISDNGAIVNGTVIWQPNDISEINKIDEETEELVEVQPIISAQKISSVLENNVDTINVFIEQETDIQGTEDSVVDDFIGYADEVKTQSTKVIPINVKSDDIEQKQESEMQLNMTLGKMSSFFMANKQDAQSEMSKLDPNPIKVTSRRIINPTVKLPDLFTAPPKEPLSVNTATSNDGIMKISQLPSPANCTTVVVDSHKTSNVPLKGQGSSAIGNAFCELANDNRNFLSEYSEIIPTVKSGENSDKITKKE